MPGEWWPPQARMGQWPAPPYKNRLSREAGPDWQGTHAGPGWPCCLLLSLHPSLLQGSGELQKTHSRKTRSQEAMLSGWENALGTCRFQGNIPQKPRHEAQTPALGKSSLARCSEPRRGGCTCLCTPVGMRSMHAFSTPTRLGKAIWGKYLCTCM